jgi:hypothetical protein
MHSYVFKGTALTWYNDNVDGGGHQLDKWSFKTMVMGLYDHFLHKVVLGSASNEFGNAMYIPGEGIMAFYYRLTWYAAWMDIVVFFHMWPLSTTYHPLQLPFGALWIKKDQRMRRCQEAHAVGYLQGM